MDIIKRCCGCKSMQPVEKFGTYKSSKDGFNPYCFDCRKLRRLRNKQQLTDYNRQYFKENKERLIEKSKQWQKENAEEKRIIQANYFKRKYHNDPRFKQKRNAQNILRRCLLGGDDKRSKALDMLGYTRQQFCDFFADQIAEFKASNTPIHIDHKIPWSWFKKDTDIKVICDLRNIRLVTKDVNIEKMANTYTEVPADYFALIKQYVTQPVRYKLYT
jgi:hypothetical protein